MDGSFQRAAEALDAADLVFPILTDPPPPPRAGSLDQYYDHLLDLFELRKAGSPGEPEPPSRGPRFTLYPEAC